jgi:hypothetical protein
VKLQRWWRLAQRRTVWWPTLLGWLCIVILAVGPAVWWCSYGESFLSLNRQLPADVLVVEGWIGPVGTRAAGAEFEKRGYQYIVASGGLTGERWNEPRWSYAEGAGIELARFGIPADKIIVAPSKGVENQRTFESAVAVWRALQARGIQPRTLNVFTFGAHARRSRMVFAKVFRPGTEVGVIAWTPPGFEVGPWWRSSERSRELLTETAGYLYEAVFNSGRRANSPSLATSEVSAQHP